MRLKRKASEVTLKGTLFLQIPKESRQGHNHTNCPRRSVLYFIPHKSADLKCEVRVYIKSLRDFGGNGLSVTLLSRDAVEAG